MDRHECLIESSDKLNVLQAVTIPARELPVLAAADVVVCGGGPAGIAAALAARRAGRRVILLEQTGMLGGMGTAGLVPAIIVMDDGERVLADGICREVVDELARRMGEKPNYHWQNIQPEILKSLYDELVSAAGIQLYLGLPAVDTLVENGRISAVVVATRSGLKAVRGHIFIDTTGDGNISAWAGAACEIGDEQGRTMSPSLCVQYAGVDWETYKAQAVKSGGSASARWHQLMDAGKAPVEERHFVGFFPNGRAIGTGNLGHIYGINALDEHDITRGYVEGRRIAGLIHRFYQEQVPGFASSELVNTAPLLSVRETRRIRGDYKLCYADYLRRAVFADEIGRFAYSIDIHSSSTNAAEQEAVERRLESTRLKKGESYGIPYRALIPQGLVNLLVAGRCISCDREVQSSLRVMPACFITGQAAGAAATLAADSGKGEVRSVKIEQLQSLLRRQGALHGDGI
jgi:hypothetical protein